MSPKAPARLCYSGTLRRILEHLGRWAPEATGRDPPAQAPDWPPTVVIPLTYHAAPEIA